MSTETENPPTPKKTVSHYSLGDFNWDKDRKILIDKRPTIPGIANNFFVTNRIEIRSHKTGKIMTFVLASQDISHNLHRLPKPEFLCFWTQYVADQNTYEDCNLYAVYVQYQS
jgi:hypothetical protein